jgi:hypothetical protein
MHILEQYAVNCGAKIEKPYIFKEFIPIPFEKYIVIHAGSGMESKNYDYYDDVVSFLLPYLNKENIKIVQIGGEKERKIKNCYHLLGTTKKQLAYIIDNSLLYFGNDTISLHFASYFGKKIVCASTVLYEECFYPYWSSKEDYKIINSHRNGLKPSFSHTEVPKTINFIPPEEITKEILEFLNIKDYELPKSIFRGDRSTNPIIEISPMQLIDKNTFGNFLLNIRLDYFPDFNDLSPIIQNLQIRPATIVTNRPINLDILQHFKKHISSIIYDVTDNIDINFISSMNMHAIKNIIIFKMEDNNNNKNLLTQRQLEIINLPNLIESIKINKFEFNNIDIQKTIFRTNKIFIHNNKLFTSRAAQLEDQPSEIINDIFEINLNKINNLALLNEDLDYGYIYIDKFTK